MSAIANIAKPPCSTLTDVVEEYLITRGMSNVKNYIDYLVIAKRVWQKFFWNTIGVIKSEWLTIQKGDPYDFVYVPKNCVRFFAVSDIDRHNKIVPLYYNEQINTIPLPASQKCGCAVCGCTGSQDELSGLTYTTQLLFTLNGIDYFEKSWFKYCSNGDIIQYREVPTKKYNDAVGSNGDFNNDFNNDFRIQTDASGNYEIVTEVIQKKICSLSLAPCGCPDNTEENQKIVSEFCGCFPGGFEGWWDRRHRRENLLFQNINNNERGEVKMSQCGTMIYYIPPKHHHHRPLPKFLLCQYQTNGLADNVDGSVVVPEYAYDLMSTGIDHGSKRFNNKYSLAEKQEAKWAHEDEINKVILFLNPISLDWLQNVTDREVKW